ncbi:small nucleolar ribonucleoprotein complex subunit, putative [Talaromyces stipitatus ATCC 10500]|uniref:Small nucleolar ribonucleoprotein complex subunit, putative n=1 Tax=Talaromyces stipitatus (strain ATCC 10500 / CBS 375.48 / QM 6759 / NRRL 1006) TaxID=441959 RepID=B8MKB5_TALSN|nr:rRNA processing protein RRP9 [Talaromyces stipitatus ATCC 10500]EED15270.1 small nucleolar ribonucleoprotein complex subunit, putative [Talaromyces stipitatus ATCC 10500]
MSSFFTLPASQRKRKRDDRVAAPGSKKRGIAAKGNAREDVSRRRQERDDDESISGSDLEDADAEDVSQSGLSDDATSEDSDEGETAAERRLKLAERYLENIREEVDEAGFDAAEIDRDLIAERLKEDVDEAKGRIFRKIASQLNFSGASHSFFRADTQTTTSVAIHPPFAYTVSKDRTLIKWELITPKGSQNTKNNSERKRPDHPGKKKPIKLKFVKGLKKIRGSKDPQGHTGNILALAVSPSGKYLATGGEDKKLIIWDAETLTPMKTFTQHRDTVSSLSFTRHISSHSSGEQLFSGSFDRTIKTWSLSSGGHAYVETLFGHQDHVSSVASMMTDQCVSVGARDRTARLWKVIDETQLVFRGESSKKEQYQNNTIDCVAVIPPTHFVTGSDSGSLSLWSIHKKKPLHTIQLAHGVDPIPPPEKVSSETNPETAAHNTRFLRPMPRWITALTTVPGTDVVLSGSWDGWIRAWKVSDDKKTLISLGPLGSTRTPQPKHTFFKNGDVEQQQQQQQQQQPTSNMEIDQKPEEEMESLPLLKGVVNSIAVFERRPEANKSGTITTKSKKKKSSSKLAAAAQSEKAPIRGLCVVAALGKEHRFSRFNCFANNHYKGPSTEGRNGAVVFEVPFFDNVDHEQIELEAAETAE